MHHVCHIILLVSTLKDDLQTVGVDGDLGTYLRLMMLSGDNSSPNIPSVKFVGCESCLLRCIFELQQSYFRVVLCVLVVTDGCSVGYDGRTV